MRVRELAEWLGAPFEGDGEKELERAGTIESAGASELTFVSSRKAAKQSESSSAGCLIVPLEYENAPPRTVIRVPDPRTAFARAVSREDITKGAEELGVPLDEHISFCIDAMRAIAEELGIQGPPQAPAGGAV